jgi:hypothetical protein
VAAALAAAAPHGGRTGVGRELGGAGERQRRLGGTAALERVLGRRWPARSHGLVAAGRRLRAVPGPLARVGGHLGQRGVGGAPVGDGWAW